MKKYLNVFITFIFACLMCVCNASWTVSDDSIGEVIFKKVNVEPVAYIIGKDNKYTSIEKALEVAQSGDIVTVIPGSKDNYCDKPNEIDPDTKEVTKVWENKVIPDKVSYTINRDCEIKNGVTLLLPLDNKSLSTIKDINSLNTYIESMKTDDRSRGTDSSYARFANENSNLYLRTSINIADNVTLTNNGNLVISGYLGGGSNSTGRVGQTSHSYSEINLGRNAKIIQNSQDTNTYCFGYINEKTKNNGSLVNLKGGNLHVPFVCADYRGFSFSFAMTDGAINNNRCSPFNQFIFNNITSNLNIYDTSNVESYINMFVKYSNPNVNKSFIRAVPLIGKDSNHVIQLNNPGAYINFKYDPNTTIAKVKFNGGLILNNININFKESIVNIDLSTKNTYLPISYHYDIELNNLTNTPESIFDASKQRIKLLPGSKMKINSGATIKGTDLIVYSSLHEGGVFNGYSSTFSSGSTYPLKEGALLDLNGGKINVTTTVGTIYGDISNITATNKTATVQEPWTLKSSGSLNPPWTITDFLDINEELQVLAHADINKPKLYCGTNIYSLYEKYPSKYKVLLSNGETKMVNKFQKVFVLEDNKVNYKLDFEDNIDKMFVYNKYYNKNQQIEYNANNSIIGSINSVIPISSNNNGINEFNAQSVNIKCTTPLIEGKIPLWPDSSIALDAEVIDIDKIYNKELTWKSSDPSIAKVDDNGIVTGVSLGHATITAECDGIIGSFPLDVIEKINTGNIESIYITDDSGASSLVVKGTNNDGVPAEYNNNYANGANPVFKVNINPIDAPYASIKWTFTASAAGRQYVNDNTLKTEVIENQDTITVHIVSGSGKSDDTANLKCEVIGLDGTLYSATFVISHNGDACFEEGSLVTMADGTQKKIEDLNIYDMVLAFNHETGQYEATPILAIGNHKNMNSTRVILKFDDNSEFNIVATHELFDYNLMKYVHIDGFNYKDYIGHQFVKYDGTNNITLKTLVDAETKEGYFNAYSLATYRTLNAVVNDTLSATTMTGFDNYFEYDENLKYDAIKMQQDIDKYGLYTYDDFVGKIPEFIFDGFNVQYLKVSIGKGMADENTISSYVSHYHYYINNHEMIVNDKLINKT